MDEDDEYSLHYNVLDWNTKGNKNSLAVLMKHVVQRGNPFNLEQPKGIMNIATGCNFRKGWGRLSNELLFFRKACNR